MPSYKASYNLGPIFDDSWIQVRNRIFMGGSANLSESPTLSETQETPLAEAKTANQFLVGCDPEFVVLDSDGKLINAADYTGHAGVVGYDHDGRVWELRPAPSRSIRDIYRRLRGYITGDWSKTKLPSHRYRWRAGALVRHSDGEQPLGGHIHLDVPLYEPVRADGLVRQYSARAREVIGACDEVTRLLESVELLPSTQTQERRRKWPNYGEFSNIREAGPRGHERIEYRTPPSWLFDPRVALLSLCLYKLAAVDPKSAQAIRKGSLPAISRFLEHFVDADDDARFIREHPKVLPRSAPDPDRNFVRPWRQLEL